ncbi:MAG: phosphomethylpyrimidine synthase ThiC [Desulfovibrionaceae bacterium]|nr:phosphomethylpyrimidine synthase ThiC [Desulfovibrionaceae bacterium]MBF0513066.1 phosphomethylpyrimidine synthase ThiC [Desulfovibrionaceae bacterium]
MPLLAKNDVLAKILAASRDDLAAYEHLATEELEILIDAGRMVLLANPAHPDVLPTLIGQPGRIKINANIGTSPFICEPGLEIEKLKAAEAAGADTIMDLSTAGDLDAIRRAMLAASRLPLGTVPIYAVAQKHANAGGDPADFSAAELLEEIAKQAEQGVDFMTLHAGVTVRAAALAGEGRRVLGIVSRGGSILSRWMRKHDRENPLLENYARILDICRRHNVVISLGDGLRPGAGADAGDAAQWEEVVNLGELTLTAWEAGVQVMIEGPGHVPLHLIASQIQAAKRLTHFAPLYVLGPLATDAAPGRDHISGAIGGALGAYHGADFLCYLTPAEHLTLPDLSDTHEGVIASRIAAQCAEAALGRPWAVARERNISEARAALDWEAMAVAALDPQIVRRRRQSHSHEKECAMCGKLCAIKMKEL